MCSIEHTLQCACVYYTLRNVANNFPISSFPFSTHLFSEFPLSRVLGSEVLVVLCLGILT